MKTMRKNLVFPVLISGALIFNGCQKEEITPNIAGEKQSTTEYRLGAPYNLIAIDHQPAQTTFPSYKVFVKSNGEVTFVGVDNTALKGTEILMISKDKLQTLQQILLETDLNHFENLPFLNDVPLVILTVRPSADAEPVTRIEYIGRPSALTGVYEKIENILDIGAWVHQDVRTEKERMSAAKM
jgi:hypothetical protein